MIVSCCCCCCCCCCYYYFCYYCCYFFFVHVVDEAPIFKISGFINSSKVLGTGQYLTTFGLDRPACHSVPLNLLNDINEIKKI